MFIRCTGRFRVDVEFDFRGVVVSLSDRFDEEPLTVDVHPFIKKVVKSQQGSRAPVFQVSDRVEPATAFGIREDAGCAVFEIPGGGLDADRSVGVRSTAPRKGHHATGADAADGDSCLVDFGSGRQLLGHLVEFPDHLFDDPENRFRFLTDLVVSLPMTGKIQRTGCDACTEESQEPSGVECLLGGPTVHPDQKRCRMCSRFREHQQGRDIGSQSEKSAMLIQCRMEFSRLWHRLMVRREHLSREQRRICSC